MSIPHSARRLTFASVEASSVMEALKKPCVVLSWTRLEMSSAEDRTTACELPKVCRQPIGTRPLTCRRIDRSGILMSAAWHTSNVVTGVALAVGAFIGLIFRGSTTWRRLDGKP